MSDYWKKKMDELEKETKKSPSQSYWDRKRAELEEEKKRKTIIKDDDDIAPVKSSKDDGKIDFFQKSSLFDDGWDFGDVTKTILGSVGDAGVNAVKGVGGLVEGLTDLASYGVAGVADAIGKDSFADNLRKKTQESYVDKLMKPAEDYLDKYSVFGRTSDAILQGVGQVGGIMATGGLGAAAGLGTAGATALTTGVMGLSGMGSGMGEAYKGGATDEEATLYGAISGTADAISELIFGGLGKAVNAVGLSKGLSSADDILAKKVSSMFSNQIMKNFSEFGIKAGAEGFEEVLAGIAQAAGKKATYMSEEEFGKILQDENLLEQFVVGAVTSGIAQTPGLHIANKTGSDFITGLNQNEQAVVKKEIENRIAEAEADGTKLSAKEKSAIEAQVEKDLEKGYISTDLIDEVVGGFTYQAYKDSEAREDALFQEYEELGKATNPTLAQQYRYRELDTRVKSIKDNDLRSRRKEHLNQYVAEQVKGSRLAESYNEKARVFEDYKPDYSKYEGMKHPEAARKTVESVLKVEVNGKKVNNTNRIHDFVDMVAKASGDTGIVFTIKSGEQIKTDFIERQTKEIAKLEAISEPTAEQTEKLDKLKDLLEKVKSGKVTVNGDITAEGIVLSLDSKKPLNRLVGHEITHSFEPKNAMKAKDYDNLKQHLFSYAKSKGVDIESEIANRKLMYEGVTDADPEAELVADLVGDFLFNDVDYIRQLSVENRNIFQRVYDEIKHLLKMATAGSKEARELEKVKRAFEKAYRESGKKQVDTKYHVSQNFETEIDKTLRNEMAKNSQVKARDFTPEILVKSGVKDLPMLITQKHIKSTIYTEAEAKEKGLPTGGANNYHGLGKDLLVRAIDNMDNPLEVYRQDGDHYLVITEMQNSSGDNIIIPVKIDGKGNYNDVYIDENQIKSVYGKKNLANYLARNNFQKIYEKKGTALNEGVQFSNISDSSSQAAEARSEQSPLNQRSASASSVAEAGGNVKYSLSDSDGRQFSNDELENAYNYNIESGDMYGAQMMVEQAAQNAGYAIEGYHGTDRDFWTFSLENRGRNGEMLGVGYYFTHDKDKAAMFSGRTGKVKHVFLDIKKPTSHELMTISQKEWGKFLDYAEQHRDEYIDSVWKGNPVNKEFEIRDMLYYDNDAELIKAFIDSTAGRNATVAEGYLKMLKDSIGYDGLIYENGDAKVYVAFTPEQIKSADTVTYDDNGNVIPLSERFKHSNPDIRFSLSEAVEETKDLVALHNLTADKLTKSLELGGLPMPSLAITKADIPHSNFGEITLIFGRETIDPKANKKNKAYSADAWTPVFPRVEYEADSKVGNRISHKLSELETKIDDHFQRDLRRLQYGFDDYLNSQGGEEGLIQYAMDNYGLKAAYLEEQGKHIEKVTKQEEAEKGFNPDAADKYLAIMDILGVSTAEELGKVNLKDARDNHGAELEAVYPGITKTAMRMGRLFNVVRSYLESKDSSPVYNTVTDSNATRKAVDDALDLEGFEAWTRNLFSGIVKDSGIYNNKELYTPSGNRRTFKQTHLPATLENIVKAMASQNNGNAKNVSGFNGIKTLRAATAETFKSVEDMHKRKGRLQNRTQEEADAINDALQEKLFKIIHAIDEESGQKWERNPCIRFDIIGETIAEIGEGGKYNVSDIQKAFSQYGREISDDTALEVKQLLYDVTQMPVNIFESKPQRVVSFDEAKVFVIPYDADIKLKQELLSRGYSIAEYDPKVEGDRQRVVNQFEEYKFSLSDAGTGFTPVGRNEVYGKDLLRQDAPVQEEIAPTVSEAESVAPVVTSNLETATGESSAAEMFPDDLAPVESELDKLYQQKEVLENRIVEAVNSEDMDAFTQANTEYDSVMTRIEELENEISETENARVGSLDDADAPPEMEAPYPGEASEPMEPADPFADRDMFEVGKRNVKAYQYENPEVKPFFTEAALGMLDDLRRGTKGEKIFNGDVYYQSGGEKGWDGTKRSTTADIAALLDEWHYTYAEIEAGLNAIIEDDGKENNAVSKRIEFMLDDRLRNGYTDVWGERMPANQEYINLLNEKQITEYSKEAFERFMATADQYAPPEDIAPVKQKPVRSEQMKLPLYHDPNNVSPAMNEVKADGDIAPVFETESGQQSILEPVTSENAASTRKALHARIMDNIKARFAEKGFDFDNVLKEAKNLSTFATVDNIPQRVMEKALGYKEGGILSDITVNQVAQNETKGIKWLNSFTDRKKGLLAQISKQYNIKPGSKESAAAQMYAEGFYVNEQNEIISYGDRELAADFPDAARQAQIKGLARDPRIRKIYDDTLKAINESRTRNAYPEIPRLDNYFLHFRAMNDTFSKLGLPFNPNDIRAKDLPTDLNGVTADLKPGQPFFASAMHREGKRTSFDLLGGLEQYLSSAKNQIYHIDDIQNLRALRNYIADTYGQANGLEGLDALSEEEQQDRIEQVYDSHLSTFAKFLNEEANVLAGKTALIDRGLEGIIGRRGMTFLDTVNRQVGANMVGYNVSSSLTNFLSPVQAFAKTNKAAFIKGMAQFASNKVQSIYGKGDGFAEQSPVMIRRKGAERFHRTLWQKMSDPGYALMSAVDSVSTELIARAKYNDFVSKGMDSQKAHIETDKWVSRLMGDRSLGQQPQLYNSKMLGIVTKFQLEVRNQLDSQFYDTIQETKASNEDIENGLLRNAKTAAKVTSTFVQLAVAQHLFGKAFESIAGYNPAFDIISAIIKTFGWDDDEESEDTALDNIEQGFLELLEDMPYSSTFTGGRIPISSALPVAEFIKGKDQYGNEKSRWETLGEAAPYYLMPGGYGQVKKTVAGLDMFSDEHPIAGSYTDSGKLRFPVDDTLASRAQAAVFGQYASQNARDYFDNERSALTDNQVQEFIDVGLSIQDYWKYRDGLKGLSKLEEKIEYVNGLNLTTAQKNVLVNNLTDRKEPIDMTDYNQYSGLEEFDFANKHPAKYAFFEEIGITYDQYKNADDDAKDAYDWAFDNPEKYPMSKAVASDVVEYRRYASELYNIKADKDENGKSISGSRKEKVLDYINSLDIDYGAKLILFKNEYNSDDESNYEIIDYLNSRSDISYEEEVAILRELGFTVTSDGTIYWD